MPNQTDCELQQFTSLVLYLKARSISVQIKSFGEGGRKDASISRPCSTVSSGDIKLEDMCEDLHPRKV